MKYAIAPPVFNAWTEQGPYQTIIPGKKYPITRDKGTTFIINVERGRGLLCLYKNCCYTADSLGNHTLGDWEIVEDDKPGPEVYAVTQTRNQPLNNFTPGKRYRVFRECDNGFYVVDDRGYSMGCLWHGCVYIGGENWERIDEQPTN